MNRLLYETPFGTLLLIVQKQELIYCNWISPECDRKLLAIEREATKRLGENDIENLQLEQEEEIAILKKAELQLKEYFESTRRSFDLPLSFHGSLFQKKVWKELANINWGETISYKELARRIGNENAARAVASACGANPLCILVPCHRVIASNGGIGGYTGGVDKKASLLSLETKLT